MKNLTYVVDGKEIRESADTQRAALARCAVVCNFAESEEEQEVRAFHREEEFQRWARSQRFSTQLEQVDEMLAKAREYETTDHQRALDRQQVLNQRVIADLRELAEHLGLSLSSWELFDQAHRGLSLLEPPILHSAILFDGEFQGLNFILPSGIPIPTFGKKGNDKAESVVVSPAGFVMLADRTWWRGAKCYFGGYNNVKFMLDELAFENKAASGLCL